MTVGKASIARAAGKKTAAAKSTAEKASVSGRAASKKVKKEEREKSYVNVTEELPVYLL